MRTEILEIVVFIKTYTGVVKQVKCSFILTLDADNYVDSYRCEIPPVNEDYYIINMVWGYSDGKYIVFFDWLQSLNISDLELFGSLSPDGNLNPIEWLVHNDDASRTLIPMLYVDNTLYRDGNVSHDLVIPYQFVPEPEPFDIGFYNAETNTVSDNLVFTDEGHVFEVRETDLSKFNPNHRWEVQQLDPFVGVVEHSGTSNNTFVLTFNPDYPAVDVGVEGDGIVQKHTQIFVSNWDTGVGQPLRISQQFQNS